LLGYKAIIGYFRIHPSSLTFVIGALLWAIGIVSSAKDILGRQLKPHRDKEVHVSKRWRIVLIVSAGLVLLLGVAYLGMGYVIYTSLANVEGSCDEHMGNNPTYFVNYPEWPEGFDPSPFWMDAYEGVRFPSREADIEIAGWWIERDPEAPAVLFVDGLGGCKNSIAVLVPAGMLWHNGYNVLLIDLRDTGDSTREDGRSAIGNDEYLDVLGAWDWLVEKQGYAPERIGVFANSLGGAAALYAFSEEPQVEALLLQSTFGNLGEIVAAELTRNGYPAFLTGGVFVVAPVVSGDNLLAHDPFTAIAAAGTRPVFVIHSPDDTRIACDQGRQLVAAAQAARVNVAAWYPAGCEHMQVPAVLTEEFEQRIVAFYDGALAR
jgi:pimeloyl-ACP methyl ester carboxylesterase